MVAIASRASWGAVHKNGDLNLSGLASEVFVHHTVTAQLPANATVAQEREQVRAIERIGRQRGFPGISYNVLIFPSGRAYQGVSWNRRGAHTAGRNSTSRSICFVGNLDVHQPTAAALATARAIFHHGKGRWWTTGAPLRGHRNVKATACPGRHVYARLADIRRAPAASTPAPAPARPTAPAAPAPAAPPVLRTGSTGQRVRDLQTGLRRVFPSYRNSVNVRRGELIGVDGDFGRQTDAWVREFQRRSRLEVDGRVGPLTRAALATHGIRV